jgi:NADH-quinone oxidoreductase subunit L
MTVPLIVLAGGAAGVGLASESPVTHWFTHLLGLTPDLRIPSEHATHWELMILSTVVAAAGVAAGWVYLSRPELASRTVARLQGLYQLSLNKFHFDELYDFFIVKPLAGLAAFCRVFDLYVLDGFVDLVGQLPRFFGQLFRPIQNGLVQFYALAMTLSVAVFLTAMLWRLAAR